MMPWMSVPCPHSGVTEPFGPPHHFCAMAGRFMYFRLFSLPTLFSVPLLCHGRPSFIKSKEVPGSLGAAPLPHHSFWVSFVKGGAS